MRLIRCVVFDLDGTLVDTGDLFYRLWTEVIRSAGLAPIHFDQVGDAWASACEQTCARRPQLRGIEGEPRFAKAWEQVLAEMLADGDMRLYPDAHAILRRLRASGRKLCLASNTPKRFVEMKLEHFALGPHFEMVFTPQDVWGGKPNPASLHHVMERFGLRPEEVAMIGDLLPDILYGQNGSVRTIGIVNHYDNGDSLAAAEPGCIIEGLAELPQAPASCVADGLMTQPQAIQVAARFLFHNPRELYQLDV